MQARPPFAASLEPDLEGEVDVRRFFDRSKQLGVRRARGQVGDLLRSADPVVAAGIVELIRLITELEEGLAFLCDGFASNLLDHVDLIDVSACPELARPPVL